MGVYIKGMEMPKNEPLLVKINPDGSVSTTAKNGYKKYEAVPVPPHGDLIDRDALYKEFERSGWFNNADRDIAEDALLDAPTVLEKEEVYSQYTDTAGNFHWCGTHSGEHTIKAEEKET